MYSEQPCLGIIAGYALKRMPGFAVKQQSFPKHSSKVWRATTGRSGNQQGLQTSLKHQYASGKNWLKQTL